jgi:hypothetical protein
MKKFSPDKDCCCQAKDMPFISAHPNAFSRRSCQLFTATRHGFSLRQLVRRMREQLNSTCNVVHVVILLPGSTLNKQKYRTDLNLSVCPWWSEVWPRGKSSAVICLSMTYMHRRVREVYVFMYTCMPIYISVSVTWCILCPVLKAATVHFRLIRCASFPSSIRNYYRTSVASANSNKGYDRYLDA